MAGLVRDLLADGGEPRAQGLAARDRRPRRRLARSPAPQGGGGHRRAAGFSTDLEFPELVAFLRARARRAALSSPRRRSSCWSTSPPAITSHDVVARRAAAAAARGVKVGPRGHARPVRDRAAARAGRARDARAALPDGAAQALRDGRAAGLDVDHRRPRGRDRAGPDAAPSRSRCRPGAIRQRPPAYSAVKVGGERAYALARAGEAVELPEREVDGHALRAALARGRPGGVRDRVLVGHLRALAGRRPRRRLLPRAAAHRRSARSTSPTPTRSGSSPLDDALALPAGASSSTGDDARRAGHGVAVARRRADGRRCGCVDDDGLIALAEPREDGMLKPVVGFRG